MSHQAQPVFRALLGSLLMLCCLAVQAEERRMRLTGLAYAAGSDTLLYTEEHVVQLSDGKVIDHLTRFIAPDGQEIATKKLRFVQLRYAPDFEITDLRSGYLESGKAEGDAYVVAMRTGKDSKLKTKRLSLPKKDFVVDSGFELYIRENLAALREGEKRVFTMGVASELRAFKFKAVKIADTQVFGRPAVQIKVELSSLLSLVAPPIFLTYDTETNQLLRYEGMANLRDKDGERYEVRMDYLPKNRRYE